ncbi:MAG: acyl carrier protein [Clostridia bacterium]|nr:acyl carrier protein [Clostridia bacterium]MBO7169955.1 acyl carrier protein [Clostridia bacterium]
MLEEIKNLLVSELNIEHPEDVTMEASLGNDLGINSLELADLVLLCEEKFDIEIEDEDLRELITVGDVVNYLEEKLGRK